MTHPAPRPTGAARFDLTPFERWEAVTLDDVHVGFLHRVLEDGVLTTRTGFAPTTAQRAARDGLPERYLAQTQVGFTPDGDGWAWTTHEDSAGPISDSTIPRTPDRMRAVSSSSERF